VAFELTTGAKPLFFPGFGDPVLVLQR